MVLLLLVLLLLLLLLDEEDAPLILGRDTLDKPVFEDEKIRISLSRGISKAIGFNSGLLLTALILSSNELRIGAIFIYTHTFRIMYSHCFNLNPSQTNSSNIYH